MNATVLIHIPEVCDVFLSLKPLAAIEKRERRRLQGRGVASSASCSLVGLVCVCSWCRREGGGRDANVEEESTVYGESMT